MRILMDVIANSKTVVGKLKDFRDRAKYLDTDVDEISQ